MKEIRGNFWYEAPSHDILVVTTNGIVKKTGELVMGGGIARQFVQQFPQLPRLLGHRVRVGGNRPYLITFGDGRSVLSMPTKQHYSDPSPLDLIRSSAQRITRMLKDRTKKILSVRPGCGLGGQEWSDVKPILKEAGWDDRFAIISP